MTTAQTGQLQEISPDRLRRNPENPRLIFREADMNDLLESIKEVGIQVPLTVYWDPDDRIYVILDGERRWRCAQKLNLPEVPVIVHTKPTRLENILMMFNIHNVRVAWDPLPMAMKLGEVRQLLIEEGKPSGIRDLAAMTGLKPVTVRRAFELLNLPENYRVLLLQEAELPKSRQQVTADLFVEIYKAYHSINRHTPEVLDGVSEHEFVDKMVEKYRTKVVDNVVHFRDVSKIARAEAANVDRRRVIPVLRKVIDDPGYSIETAYDATVRFGYEERDLLTRIQSLAERLQQFTEDGQLTKELEEALNILQNVILNLPRH